MGLEFFGQPDELKKNVGQLNYRLRSKSNDQIRQGWLADAVPMVERLGFKVPAHFDADQRKYVIDCPFPAEFDETAKRWRFEEGPITWDRVLARWKRRGPGVQFCMDQVRAGYRELHMAAAA
jgi:ring-1,2-phenylacetyl-CoA epoxidase subunit PaaA